MSKTSVQKISSLMPPLSMTVRLWYQQVLRSCLHYLLCAYNVVIVLTI